MRLRDSVSYSTGMLALAVAVLAVGGALRWTAAVVAILVATALIPQVLSRRGLTGTSPLVVMLGVAAGLTALQLVPLPAALLDLLDSTGAGLRADGTQLAGVHAWSAITLDAPGTLRALTFFVTLLGVAVVALRLAATERGRLVCLGGVATVCGVTAAIVGAHQLFGATSLYGLYEPSQATPPVLGPLLNPNHLGGLMALGAVVSVALFLYVKQSMAARVVWALCGAGCVLVAIATLSRGAVLALGTGMAAMLGTIVAQRLARPLDASAPITRTRRRRFIYSSLPIGVIAVCTLTIIIYTSAGGAAEQLANTSLQEIHEPKSKYAAWTSAVNLIEETPWVGVGRGAFEPAFTRVHPASAFVTFSHVENEYLQAVVEWGVPGAALLAICFGWFGLVALRRWREGPLVAAGIGGLVAVTVQSNVDFGIELLGLAVPATVVAATLVCVPLRELGPAALRRARALRLGHLVVLAAAAFALCVPSTRSVAEDHEALAKAPSLPEIRASIARHPLDYFGYATAAETMVRTRDATGVAMLNQALRLHPTHPGLHRFAGRILLGSGHIDQAVVEYAEAVHGTSDPRALLDEIARRFTPAAAAQAIPSDYENVDLVVRSLEQAGHADVGLAWVARVLDLHPRSIQAIDALSALATKQGDAKLAERAARAKLEIMPSPQAKLKLAQLFAARGAHDDVIKLLDDVPTWHGRVADQQKAWLLLCDEHMATKDLDDTARCLHRLDASGLIRPEERAQIVRRLDAVDEQRRAILIVPALGSGSAVAP